MKTKLIFSSVKILLAAALMCAAALPAVAADPDYAGEITRAPLFSQPLVWVGDKSPDPAETIELWQDAGLNPADHGQDVISSLQSFIAAYPNSPWTPSLRANLARYYRSQGRYSAALDNWQKAWDATKNATDPNSRNVADYALAYWTELLASLGRVDELDQLIATAGNRRLSNPEYQKYFDMSRRSVAIMKNDPGYSYRCGTVALYNIARAMNANSNVIALIKMSSPQTGFSMSSLLKLSDQYQLGLKAVKRPFGSQLVVPSVVHWKEDHYAAIVDRQNGGYKVIDPTFGKPQWLSPNVINENASGYFMVPTNKVPDKWLAVSDTEAKTVFGKGVEDSAPPPPSPPPCPGANPCPTGTCPTNCPPGGPGGGHGPGGPNGGGSGPCGSGGGHQIGTCASCGGGGGCGPTMSGPGAGGGSGDDGNGMAYWDVQEPYISLWLHDRPMTYNMNVGRKFIVQMDYNQGETRPLSLGAYNIFNFGPNWNGNLLTYVEVSGTVDTDIEGYTCYDPITDDTNCCQETVVSGEFQASEFCPDGGESDFSWGGTNLFATMDPYTRVQFVPTTFTTTNELLVCGTLEPQITEHFNNATLTYPSGSVATFGQVVTVSTFPEQRIALLTSATDPQGHTMSYAYSINGNQILLTNIVDFNGKTNVFVYGNASFPTAITEITNYACHLAVNYSYDTNGFLTNITDAIGMRSSFQYTFVNDLFYTNYDGSGDPMGTVTNSVWLLTGLTTPYGTTSFSYFHPTWPLFGPTPDADINRAITVTQPDGGKHLFVYRDQGDSPSFPPLRFYIFGGSDDFLYWRDHFPYTTGYENNGMSFYWGPRQYAALSTTVLTNLSTTDLYKNGRIRNWFHADPAYDGVDNVLPQLAIQQDFTPSPADPSGGFNGDATGSATYYGYEGTPGYVGLGSTNDALPWGIVYQTPDASFQAENITRNALGNITSKIDFGDTFAAPFGAGENDGETKTNTYIYSTDGIDLLQHIGPNNIAQETYGYDGTHDVIAFTNALGEATHYTYNGNQQLTSITQPNGLLTTNSYNSDGYMAQQIVVGFSTNTYTYTNGLVYSYTDARGLTVTNTWDALQRLTKVTYPDGTSVSYIYSNLDVVKMIDRLGYVTSYAYDNMDRKIAETNADNAPTHYAYCTCGSLDAIQDAMGNITTFTYDNAGRLTNTLYPDGYSIAKFYTGFNTLSQTADSGGDIVQNYIDWQVDVIGVTNLSVFSYHPPSIATYGYDVYRRVTNSVNNELVAKSVTYDNLNRLLTRSWPDGGIESFGYSTNVSGPTSYTNQIGNVTLYAYDAMGRKTNEIVVGITTNAFNYDGAGDLLALTDGNGHTTSWGYDQYGRVTNKLDAAGITNFVYKYDNDNRLTNRWTPAKGNTVYQCDQVGNLLAVTYPHSPSVSLAYDGDNRLIGMVDGIGTTTYSYDQAGQLLSEGGLWPDDTVNYNYQNRLRASLSISAPNAAPWLQRYSYDVMRRLSNSVSPAGIFSYEYPQGNQPPAGPLAQEILLPNGFDITNSYDANARLLSTVLQNSAGTSLDSQSYSYNSASERTTETNTAGDYHTYGYDSAGELRVSVGRDPSGTLRIMEARTYGYDAAGNMTFRGNPPGSTRSVSYSVNNLNQITNATMGSLGSASVAVSGSTTISASSVKVNGTSVTPYADNSFYSSQSVANGLNAFTAIASDTYGRWSTNTSSVTVILNNTNFSYDLNGNLLSDGVRNFAYDDENELISVCVSNAWSNSFAYDGKMRRRIERDYTWNAGWVQTNEIHFVYDGRVVMQERNVGNIPQITYTRGVDLSGTFDKAGGIGGLLARTETPQLNLGDPFATAFYHADGNGNVTYLMYTNGLQAAKYLYDPYGNTLATSGFLASANKYRFSSREWNNNAGLYCYLYRFYDPNMQKWLNKDPIGELGGLNLYEFVADNPVSKIDVWGLDCEGDCFNTYNQAQQDIQKKYEQCLAWYYGITGVNQCLARPRPPVTWPLLLGGLATCGAKAIAAQTAASSAYAGCLSGCNAPSCPSPYSQLPTLPPWSACPGPNAPWGI